MTTDSLNHTYGIHSVEVKRFGIIHLFHTNRSTQLGSFLTCQVNKVVRELLLKCLVYLCRHFTLLLINIMRRVIHSWTLLVCMNMPDPCGLPGLKMCQKQLSAMRVASLGIQGEVSFSFFPSLQAQLLPLVLRTRLL